VDKPKLFKVEKVAAESSAEEAWHPARTSE